VFPIAPHFIPYTCPIEGGAIKVPLLANHTPRYVVFNNGKGIKRDAIKVRFKLALYKNKSWV
jgi:hypothetical protein